MLLIFDHSKNGLVLVLKARHCKQVSVACNMICLFSKVFILLGYYLTQMQSKSKSLEYKPFNGFVGKNLCLEVSLLNNTHCIKTSLTDVYFSGGASWNKDHILSVLCWLCYAENCANFHHFYPFNLIQKFKEYRSKLFILF